MTVRSRPGVSVRFLVVEPTSTPKAALVAFTGHSGVLGLTPGWPQGKRSDQFFFRTADLFAARGILVAVVDAPSDRRKQGLFGFRSTAAHARDAAAVLAAVRRLTRAPVWTAGTSYGAVSAANAAARLGAAGPDGVVLTSSVVLPQRLSRETLYSVDLSRIAVPLLVVRDGDDACPTAPPSAAPDILARACRSPRKQALTFSGGPRGTAAPCRPLSPHGFLGLETPVVEAISRWIEGARAP